MKSLLTTLSLAAVLVAVPVDTFLSRSLTSSSPAIAQAQQQQNLELELVGQLKVVKTNWRGQQEVAWRNLDGGFFRPAPTVRPGDIVRFTISGNNRTDQPISGLVLTDDLPANMVYVMDSAVSVGGATITYSIDGGKTYTANPTIQVRLPDGTMETRPAPADRYTHVRWTFQSAVPAKGSVNGQYQVRVR